MSPNVDVRRVAVERRDQKALRSLVPLGMEAAAVLEKLVSRVPYIL